MSSFRDLLNNPLPSTFMESDDYSDEIDDTEEGCAGSSCESDDYSDDTEEGCGSNKSEHGDYDDYDDEYDDDYDHHHHHHHHDDYDHHHHHHHHHDDEYHHHHDDDHHHHHHHDYYEGEGDYDDDLDDDYDDDDLDGISDDIADDISVDDIEDEVDAEVGDTVDDDELEVDDELTPEEEKEVEDETALVATPIILKDELTAEEYAEFGESVDADIAVDEGFLLESDIDIFADDVVEESIKPMRFSKQSVIKARTNQIRWIVMRSLARKRNDPRLYKLEKAYKIRRKIKADFEKTYGAKADQITRKYIMRLKSSNSPVLARVGKKLGINK